MLDEGEHREGYVVEVGEDAVLEGGVLTADGRPAADVPLQVLDETGQALFILSELRTDYTGSFRIPGIGPGRVRLVAEGPDGSRAEGEAQLGPGEVGTLVLTLAR